MIPRAEIAFTLAMAEKGVRSETPPDVMAELCRVYLAWLEAPEGWVVGQSGPDFADKCTGAIVQMADPPSVKGKRVRLVVVDE